MFIYVYRVSFSFPFRLLMIVHENCDSFQVDSQLNKSRFRPRSVKQGTWYSCIAKCDNHEPKLASTAVGPKFCHGYTAPGHHEHFKTFKISDFYGNLLKIVQDKGTS